MMEAIDILDLPIIETTAPRGGRLVTNKKIDFGAVFVNNGTLIQFVQAKEGNRGDGCYFEPTYLCPDVVCVGGILKEFHGSN
jgi:hypothetical protein